MARKKDKKQIEEVQVQLVFMWNCPECGFEESEIEEPECGIEVSCPKCNAVYKLSEWP